MKLKRVVKFYEKYKQGKAVRLYMKNMSVLFELTRVYI